jgi:hypothetical protein
MVELWSTTDIAANCPSRLVIYNLSECREHRQYHDDISHLLVISGRYIPTFGLADWPVMIAVILQSMISVG